MSGMWSHDPEHWGPVEAVWPDPEDMLQDDLLGVRVGWWALMGDLDSMHEDPGAAWAMTMFAQVCDSARAHGFKVPAEWYPANTEVLS